MSAHHRAGLARAGIQRSSVVVPLHAIPHVRRHPREDAAFELGGETNRDYLDFCDYQDSFGLLGVIG